MSGFEIAGIVLGAMPLVIQTIERLKDNFRAATYSRIYVDKLSEALILNQTILQQVVRLLLSNGGYGDIWQLKTNPIRCLEDTEAHRCLAKSLGPESSVFIDMMKHINSAIGEVAKNISGLRPLSSQSNSENVLLHIIESNKRRKMTFRSKLQLFFKAGDLKASIDEIDKTTKDLQCMATTLALNRTETEQTASQDVNKLSRGFRLVRGLAGNLYSALHRGWQHECRYDHQITLHLDDRVNLVIASLQYHRNSEVSLPGIDFQLLHTTFGNSQAWCHWVHIDVLPVKYRHSRRSKATDVQNICAMIYNPKSNSARGCLVLVENKQLNWITPRIKEDREPIKEVSLNKTMTLRDGLSRKGLMPLRFRCSLALRLSSNLLQLLKTPWFSQGSIQDAIFFPIHETQDEDPVKIDWDYPLILADFTSTLSSTSMEVLNAKEILLELGIVLLELWHEVTLEEKFSEFICPKSGFGRRECANKWFDESRHLLTRLYDKAACHCIGGIIGGQVHLDWEDARFWEAYCADIIAPLYRNCEPWL